MVATLVYSPYSSCRVNPSPQKGGPVNYHAGRWSLLPLVDGRVVRQTTWCVGFRAHAPARRDISGWWCQSMLKTVPATSSQQRANTQPVNQTRTPQPRDGEV